MNSRFLTLIFLLLIVSIFSSRKLREENNEEKEEENDCEDGTCESKNEPQTDFSKVSSSKIKKENMPHSQVLLPIRRVGTTNMELGDAHVVG
jgi:cbb3-type cytochrome oxidase subunit 3